eukprot:4415143-Ditylum_brightwellii.AAC.1
MQTVFLNKFRSDFLKRHGSLSRDELNTRNSNKRPMKRWELVASKYNYASWVPSNRLFSKFHFELSKLFLLNLPVADNDNHSLLTPDKVKTAFRDAKGRVNWAIFHLKASGCVNGDKARK